MSDARSFLTLEMANVTLGKTDVLSQDDMAPDEYVMLSVNNAGVGMGAGTRSHLFEPFHSTRGLFDAPGLGSAVACGIINQYAGDIWVHSEKGKGSCRNTYLPRGFRSGLGLTGLTNLFIDCGSLRGQPALPE